MTAHNDDAAERTERRLSYEATFESLQNPRRRRTLQLLTEGDGPVTVGDLADRIAAWERNGDAARVTPEARKSVYNSLTQTHLPHLVARGIVEYDRAAGTVALASNAAHLARYVPLGSSSEDRWNRVMLMAVGVAGVVAAANWLGAFAIPAMAFNAVVVGLFFAVSLGYAVSVRS